MNTTTTTIDLDAFLELYFDGTQTPASIARQLGAATLDVMDFAAQPFVVTAIARVEAFIKRRVSIVAGGAAESILRQFAQFPPLAPDASALDIDRRRRALDSTRRAAEFLRKVHLPPPTPRATTPREEPVESPMPAFDPAVAPLTPTPASVRTSAARMLQSLAGCA
jgi:hypothetical protein